MMIGRARERLRMSETESVETEAVVEVVAVATTTDALHETTQDHPLLDTSDQGQSPRGTLIHTYLQAATAGETIGETNGITDRDHALLDGSRDLLLLRKGDA